MKRMFIKPGNNKKKIQPPSNSPSTEDDFHESPNMRDSRMSPIENPAQATSKIVAPVNVKTKQKIKVKSSVYKSGKGACSDDGVGFKGSKIVILALLILLVLLALGLLIVGAYYTSYYNSTFTSPTDDQYVVQMCNTLFIIYALIILMMLVVGIITHFKQSRKLGFRIILKIYLISIAWMCVLDFISGISLVVYAAIKSDYTYTNFCAAGSLLILLGIFKIPYLILIARRFSKYLD